MRRSWVVLTSVLVVAGLVFGAYEYGRDHPATTTFTTFGGPVTTAPLATTPKTTISTSPASVPCGTDAKCLNITDKAGDGISVTLDGEEQAAYCNVAEHGAGSYIVALTFKNTGTTILDTDGDSYRDAVTLIDASSTAYSTDYGASCGYQNAPVAVGLPECKNSAYTLDLTPGSTAVWCPLINFPESSTLEKIQFNSTDFFSPAFSQAGIDNAVTWSVGPS